MESIKIISWPENDPLSETAIRKKLSDEGLNYYPWSNSPGDFYSAHSHPYNKIIYVAHGSITFNLPEIGESHTLQSGDRLELPARTVHSALVGPDGVTCFEAHV